jgi:hypothetical protein
LPLYSKPIFSRRCSAVRAAQPFPFSTSPSPLPLGMLSTAATEKWKKAAHPDSCSGATVENLPKIFHILVNSYILKDCEWLPLRCLAVLRMWYAPTAGLVQRTRERRCSVAQQDPGAPTRSSASHYHYLGIVQTKFSARGTKPSQLARACTRDSGPAPRGPCRRRGVAIDGVGPQPPAAAPAGIITHHNSRLTPQGRRGTRFPYP